MHPNPYGAPRAELRDVPRVTATGPTPVAVRSACGLVLASLALGLLTLLPGLREPEPEPTFMYLVVGAAVLLSGGLTVWFTSKIWQGRTWARWVLLVYLAIGWAIYAVSLSDEMAAAPMVVLINAGCVVLEVLACELLFFGHGARWFAARSNDGSR